MLAGRSVCSSKKNADEQCSPLLRWGINKTSACGKNGGNEKFCISLENNLIFAFGYIIINL